MNIGEEIVSSYLEYIKKCEFIQKNLYTTDLQGEIDVVGIDLNSKTIYICEAAIHLITGLQYTKENQPNNVNKLVDKFSKDIEYARKYFPDYNSIFMLWSPIVKNAKPGAKHNQMRDVSEISEIIMEKYNVKIDFIINDRFLECLNELRQYASNETKEIKSPVLRLLQIEEHLKRFLNKSCSTC